MDDGIRTRDHWNHNPGLYQLSYAHHFSKFLITPVFTLWQCVELESKNARLTGLEPVTYGLAYYYNFHCPALIGRFVVWTISSPSQVGHV